MRRRLAVPPCLCLAVAAGALLGCGPLPTPTAPASMPEVVVGSGPAPARAALVACTYGGPRRLGRVDPKKVPARVVAVVELEARVQLAGVTLAALEVFDGMDTPIGHAVLPANLRRAPKYEPPAEPLDAETLEFDGKVAPGQPVRLWIEVPLSVPLKQVLDSSPVRVEATLDVGDGRQVQVTGRVGALWTG
jgi:hypothetical protein